MSRDNISDLAEIKRVFSPVLTPRALTPCIFAAMDFPHHSPFNRLNIIAMKTYESHRGLPMFAGVGTFEEVSRSGLSVEPCVQRLKRHHYAFKRLHQILIARLTAEPIYELKMAFSLHAYLCSEHVAAWRVRVSEMREPPLGLDLIPHTALRMFFDEILAAPTTEELLLGLYEKALPALKAALERHLADTNHLTDHPSVRLCRFALMEIADMLTFGTQAIAKLVTPKQRGQFAPWLALLDDCLAAAGQLHGAGAPVSDPARSSYHTPHAGSETGAPIPNAPAPKYSATPFTYDPVPKRDARFPDPYNMGVNAEVFLYDEKMPAKAKTLMMFYKRLREIDVPEMMASIITQTHGKPWAYTRDMTRQLWDEARHAMMGEVGFVKAGVDWHKVMVNFTWALALNTQLKPLERHAVLYFIEQGLMPKMGKRYEWDTALASGDPLAAVIQDFDWADEVLHARVGRDWYLKEFADPKEAVRYGDECWSKVLMGWRQWRDEGLTQHRNWWPDVYRDACRAWGVEPDPQVLAYDTSYETVRADLKELTGSA
jgi:hypothetical protein